MKKRFLGATLFGLLSLYYAKAQTVSGFEDLSLAPSTFKNGSDMSGGWKSGALYFLNDYNPDWFYWEGFAISSMRDSTTATWSNQYSAITARGVHGSSTYAVAYSKASILLPHKPAGDSISGLAVTNSTYAGLTIRDGDMFSKKFGGTTGNDPDYFFVRFTGINQTGTTGQVDFYLADYRYSNNSQDYLVRNWEWVDLTSLGRVTALEVSFFSSDTGMWGINTPTFVCIDSLVFLGSPGGFKPIAREDYFTLTPSQTTDLLDVLANDIAPGSSVDSLSITVVNSPVLGSLVVNGRKLELTQTSGAYGYDMFDYAICDNNGLCDTNSAYITINAAPIANNDLFQSTGIWDVLANDTDEALTSIYGIEIIDSLKSGSIIRVDSVIEVSGSYNPGDSDSLRYAICDEFYVCDTALARLRIPAVVPISIEESGLQALRVFPNPFDQLLHIEGEEIYRMQLINTAGQTVLSLEKPGKSIQIPHLPKGIYIVELETQGGTSRVKLTH